MSLYFVNSATHSDCITFYTALRTIVLVFRICNRILGIVYQAYTSFMVHTKKGVSKVIFDTPCIQP